MTKPITAEDRPHVQQFIKDGQADRISHIQDMEAIGAVAGKHDRERKAREDAQRRVHEKFEAEKRRLRQRDEELRIQEEEYQAELAEKRRDFRKAVILAGILCGLGGLNLIFAWRPDLAIVAGGVLILASVTTIVFSAIALFRI